MGEVDSITNACNYGICLFNSQQKKNLEPFVEEKAEGYEEENHVKIPITWL